MEDGQANHSPNELEIVEMLRIDSRMRIDLEGIVVMCGILE
jgi:hypothetical protein